MSVPLGKLSPCDSRHSSTFTRRLYQAYSTLPLTSRAIYQAEVTADEDRYSTELATYSARIPLSPSVHASNGELESEEAYRPAQQQRIAENERRLSDQRWARYRLDHHKACGGAFNPISAEPFDFLRLPVEIRYKIYEMVLKQEAPVKQDSSDSKGPIDVRIFTVNRQVYAAAIEVFY